MLEVMLSGGEHEAVFDAQQPGKDSVDHRGEKAWWQNFASSRKQKKKERKVNKLIERQRERESEAVKAMLIRAGIQ